MRLSKYLREKYFGLIQGYFKDEGWPVFENPTSSEIKELSRTVRFAVHPKMKKVWVWNSDVLHSSIKRELGIDVDSMFTGTAKKVGNKYEMALSDQFDYYLRVARQGGKGGIHYIKKFKWIWTTNLNWVNKYVNIKDWIEKTRPIFNEIMKLDEKYVTAIAGTYSYSPKYAEIFENPTKSEIKELPRLVRFLADPKTKKVYIWNAGIIHHEAMEHLGLAKGSWSDYISNYLPGTAQKHGNKYVMFISDEINNHLSRAKHSIQSYGMIENWSWVWEKNLNWVNRYVDISQWLRETKPQYEEIINEGGNM